MEQAVGVALPPSAEHSLQQMAGGQALAPSPPSIHPAAPALHRRWRRQWHHSLGESDVAGPAHPQGVVTVVGLCLFCVAILGDPDVDKVDLDEIRLRHRHPEIGVDNLDLQGRTGGQR